MNIKEAKEQIKNAMTAYFTKDEFGEYVIPIEKQRPVFLMGPPGIGKTAIMEQIASELGVGMVSYSMTHHTRQSALGLPFISKKIYGGKEYSVSEYTMSEIIASVYDMIEATGNKEGILFLDEINCVSETLAPSMLQFLQYKIFGKHKVPDGWTVVTAGNPPEYNNSVHDFAIVTWDRLKRIDIEPDYEVWKEYVYQKDTHPAILTYLDIRKSDFYKIETTVDGKLFVTARGWIDLSVMMRLYEQHGIAVDEKLISQYLQSPKIAKNFASYYDLFKKYQSDYQVKDILEGKATEEIYSRAKDAKFDERLSLIGLILDEVRMTLKEVRREEALLTELLSSLKRIRNTTSSDLQKSIDDEIEEKQKKLDAGKQASNLSDSEKYNLNLAISKLEEMKKLLQNGNPKDKNSGFEILKTNYNDRVKHLSATVQKAKDQLKNMFNFSEDVFGDGQEMVILVTELTISRDGAHFISKYGCDEYFKHNKELLFYERQRDIMNEIEKLEEEI
jgi:hypothetical protein